MDVLLSLPPPDPRADRRRAARTGPDQPDLRHRADRGRPLRPHRPRPGAQPEAARLCRGRPRARVQPRPRPVRAHPAQHRLRGAGHGTLWMATAVRTEAACRFIGLGVPPPARDLGRHDARRVREHPRRALAVHLPRRRDPDARARASTWWATGCGTRPTRSCGRDRAPPELDGLTKHFTQRRAFLAPSPRGARGRRRQLRPCGPARRSAWSARAAAASPPPPGAPAPDRARRRAVRFAGEDVRGGTRPRR